MIFVEGKWSISRDEIGGENREESVDRLFDRGSTACLFLDFSLGGFFCDAWAR